MGALGGGGAGDDRDDYEYEYDSNGANFLCAGFGEKSRGERLSKEIAQTEAHRRVALRIPGAPAAYLRAKRLRRAMDLLENPDLQIT
jgi:hypothetical protein